MANTYTLIASNTLTGTTASVTFSSIPGTYTDLVLRISARAANATDLADIQITLNSNTGTNYSQTWIRGYNNLAASGRNSNNTLIDLNSILSGADTTSNTFSSVELYIPSYTASQNKPLSHFGANENNSATIAMVKTDAILWRNTAAITTIKLETGGSFVSGSSFFLYGISKN